MRLSPLSTITALLLSIAPGAAGQKWFAGPKVIAEGTVIAHGDLDIDGDTDLIILTAGSIHTLVNDGSGSFALSAPTPLATGSSIASQPARLGDVDGDGDPDLVMATGASAPGNGLYVYFGQPGVGLATGAFVPTPVQVSAFDLGDFNGDGREDIAMTSFSAMSVGWVFFDGNSFQAILLPFGDFPYGVAALDHTGDGLADQVVASSEGRTARLIPTVAGQPTLGALLTVLPNGTSPFGMTVGDIDGDGDDDVAVVHNDSSDLETTVLQNTGSGLVAGPVVPFDNVGSEFSASGMTLGDMDDDGDLDVGTQTLFTLFGQGRTRAFFLENTTGSAFGAVREIAIPALGFAPGFADVDGDARLDFITSGAIVFGIGGFPTFQNGASFGIGATIADWDGDGDLDAVFGNGAYLNDGTGAVIWSGNLFPSAGSGFEFRGGIHGDFNGDGQADILVEKWQPSGTPFVPDAFIEMWLLTVLPTGFAVAIAPAAPAGQVIGGIGTQVGDFDLDGDRDVMTTSILWRNGGVGFFGSALVPPPGVKYDAADADGDGDSDLLALSGTTLSVHFNLGGGAFQSVALLTQSGIDAAPRLLDLDHDGDLDVVANTAVSSPFGSTYTLKVIENTGGGAFATPVNLDPGSVETDVYSAIDVDGDGLVDLLAASTENDGALSGDTAYGRVLVYRRTGVGLQYAPRQTWLGHRPGTFGDLDADGDVDVIGTGLLRNAQFESPAAGVIRQFGHGVAGSGGAIPLLGAQGPAKLGSTSYELRLRRGLGAAPTLIAIGLQETLIPNAPVGGMTYYIGGTTVFLGFAIGGASGQPGTGFLTIPAPISATLAGLTLYHQTFHNDPGAQFHASSSNALQVTFGS